MFPNEQNKSCSSVFNVFKATNGQKNPKANHIIKGVCAVLTESRHRWRKGSCSSPPHAPSALFAFADDAVEKEKKKKRTTFKEHKA